MRSTSGCSGSYHTQEEVRVLKEIVAALTGNGRLSFTTDQRRRLAVTGKALSPEERKKCCQIVKPVEIAGIAIDPDEAWMKQVARNLTDPVHGFLHGAKYLIHDRDPLFTDGEFACRSRLGGMLNYYYREAA